MNPKPAWQDPHHRKEIPVRRNTGEKFQLNCSECDVQEMKDRKSVPDFECEFFPDWPLRFHLTSHGIKSDWKHTEDGGQLENWVIPSKIMLSEHLIDDGQIFTEFYILLNVTLVFLIHFTKNVEILDSPTKFQISLDEKMLKPSSVVCRYI